MPSNPVLALFDDSLPTTQVAPLTFEGLAFNLTRHGSRVTGTIEMAVGCNPFGATKCRVDYLAPKSRDWTDKRRAAALRIAAHWFKDIGNLDVIDKPLLAHLIQRLKASRTEAALHITIREYARSRWHREHKKWMVPKRFFKDDDLVAKWIRESAEWKNHVTRHARAELAKQRSATGGEPTVPRIRMGPARLSDADLLTEHRRVQADRQAHDCAWSAYVSERNAAWARAYASLSGDDRRRLLAEVERQLGVGHARADGTVKINHDSDEFRRELHRRAWLRVTMDPTKAKPFAHREFKPIKLTSTFRAEQVEAEICVRKLPMMEPGL
ncbi:MAG: hypothetical protein KAV00_04825 [Phycisphaerae bacterium]|nr:hypothetical protein [Phycisphaerae bacterium]